MTADALLGLPICLAITSAEQAAPQLDGGPPWRALVEDCGRLADRLGPRAWILLRDGGPRRAASVVRDRARAVLTRVAPRGARVIVADRADVALALAGHAVGVQHRVGFPHRVGVQLPEAGLPVDAARALSAVLLVGASRHDVAGAVAAARAGADWITVGPVFPTPSKPGHAGIGLEGLAEVVRAVHAVETPRRVRVLALGGVDRARAADVRAAGADGVAGIRAAWAFEG